MLTNSDSEREAFLCNSDLQFKKCKSCRRRNANLTELFCDRPVCIKSSRKEGHETVQTRQYTFAHQNEAEQTEPA